MPPAARLGDSTAHGGAIVVGAPNVLIGGRPAARLGDAHVCPLHGGGVITQSSRTVIISGAFAARLGDMCGCAAVGVSGTGVPAVIGPAAPPPPPAASSPTAAEPLQSNASLSPRERGRMDAEMDNKVPARGPHAEAEATDTDSDGNRDMARAEASTIRMRNQGYGDLGPVEGGGRHNLDAFYGRGQAGMSTNYGVGGNASAEAGMLKQGGEVSVGGAGDDGRNPFLAVGGEYDMFHAEAKGDVLAGDDGRRIGVGAMGKAGAEVIGGKVTGRQTIPIPFTNWNIQSRGEASATAVSAGVGLGGWAYWDRQEGRLHVGALGEIAALVGVEFNIDISIGRAYEPPPSQPSPPGGSTPGVGAGGIPNMIVSGDATVIIG